MSTSKAFRQNWVETLRNSGVTDLSAALLEAVTPITLLGAQFVMISQPLLSTIFPAAHWDDLIRLLEDRQEYQAFIKAIREDPSG